MFAVKMPFNEKFYAALTSQAFKQYICDWLRSIHKSYVMDSKSLNKPLKTFDYQNLLKTFRDCDEEQKAQQTDKILPQRSENSHDANGNRGLKDHFEFKSDVSS